MRCGSLEVAVGERTSRPEEGLGEEGELPIHWIVRLSQRNPENGVMCPDGREVGEADGPQSPP